MAGLKSFSLIEKFFYDLDQLLKDLADYLKNLEQKQEKLDYITFVADGEPTLDLNLGQALAAMKKFGIKTAVISNASLITETEVRKELKLADWVSLKVDAVSEKIWRKIDRPHGSLDLKKIKEGIQIFRSEYEGKLATETMLVKGINDQQIELEKIAEPEKINLAYQIFIDINIKTEYLIGYEGNKFSSTGDLKNDLLNITAVHPLKVEAVQELINKTESSWETVAELIA